ncbi:MAG TPA: hypothetical protein VIE90_03410 [Candidatus Binatia bacterium]|jgi:hypothetical protein
MDKAEASRILAEELARYRRESYASLQRLLKEVDAYEITGPSGTNYQIEIQAVWDDQTSGNLRVIGGIDDGGLRAYLPLTDDFILSPAGELIGE